MTDKTRTIRLETERLFLRQLTNGDIGDLHKILSDPESMRHYPRPFTLAKSERWIQWNLDNYRTYGFGLWAVVRKEDGRFLGDCGLTMQSIGGQSLPEIGYHIDKAYTGRGYATEAARACRNYAFDVLQFPAVYSYMKYTNTASFRVAEKNGMRRVAELPDEKNGITLVYAITHEEYLHLED